MKKGDKVKIKSYKEIYKMLDDDGIDDCLYFEVDGMSEFCGKPVTLVRAFTTDIDLEEEPGTDKKAWRVTGNKWYWHEHWFEPPSKPFLSDRDFDI